MRKWIHYKLWVKQVREDERFDCLQKIQRRIIDGEIDFMNRRLKKNGSHSLQNPKRKPQ